MTKKKTSKTEQIAYSLMSKGNDLISELFEYFETFIYGLWALISFSIFVSIIILFKSLADNSVALFFLFLVLCFWICILNKARKTNEQKIADLKEQYEVERNNFYYRKFK